MINFHQFVASLGLDTPLKLCCQALQVSDSSEGHSFGSAQSEIFPYNLEDDAKSLIRDYLTDRTLCLHSFGDTSDAESVIAFSFGDSEEVNCKLAIEVEQLHQEARGLKLLAQSEISQHLTKAVPHIAITNKQYQTTHDVAAFALKLTITPKLTKLTLTPKLPKLSDTRRIHRTRIKLTPTIKRIRLIKPKVVVVAQSWHAQRCVQTCQDLGFQVVALRTVVGFPSKDPQPWVRSPVNWVIKESHREVATGYEISHRYNLE